MSAVPPLPPHDGSARAHAGVVVTFTPRGQRALDDLAAVIAYRIAQTPEGVARALARVYHTPLDELTAAFEAIAENLAREPRRR